MHARFENGNIVMQIKTMKKIILQYENYVTILSNLNCIPVHYYSLGVDKHIIQFKK